MRISFFLMLLLPFFAVAQVKKAKTPAKKAPVVTKSMDSFIINGEVSGYNEGAAVLLLNSQTGTPEAQGNIKNKRFVLEGKMLVPDFKVLQFDNQPVYFTIFLDNSAIKITGTKENITQLKVTGSPSHAQFESFMKAIEPYQQIFSENPAYDSAAFVNASKACENFVRNNPSSFIAPLALLRYNQITDASDNKLETLFASLTPEVKNSALSAYIVQIIADAKKLPIGSTLPDFSQADTAGNALSLASMRGKYVLVDFWASWCRPCRQENPNVVAAYNKFKDKNFTVLGVSLDKAKRAWIDAIKMDSLAWPHVSDLNGWNNAVAQQYQIASIPQNFLIDPAGKIIAKNIRGASLERVLTKTLQ